MCTDAVYYQKILYNFHDTVTCDSVVTHSLHFMCCGLHPTTTPALCGQSALNQQDGGTHRKDCVIIRLTSPLNSSSNCYSSDRLLVGSSLCSNTAATYYKLLARQLNKDFPTLKIALSRLLALTFSLIKWLFVELRPLHDLVTHFTEK